MPTYYKPTERHGKRVVYQSIDLAELKKKKTMGRIAIIIAFAMTIAFVIALASLLV